MSRLENVKKISFRTYDGRSNKMVEGSLTPPEDCFVMMDSGHKDINGKKIYQGDIVEFLDQREFNPEVSKGVVSYYPLLSSVGIQSTDGSRVSWLLADAIKVIGNVFENPELRPS